VLPLAKVQTFSSPNILRVAADSLRLLYLIDEAVRETAERYVCYGGSGFDG